MASQLEIKVLLDAVDKVTSKFKSITQGSQKLSQALKASRENLRELNRTQGQLDNFRKLQKDLSGTQNALLAAQNRVNELKRAMDSTDSPTKRMARDLESATRKANLLREKSHGLNDALKTSSEKLAAAGINTRHLEEGQRSLSKQILSTTGAIKGQEAALAKANERMKQLNDARRRYDKSLAMRSKVQGTGFSMAAGGAATGALVMRPIIDFAGAEDSAAQLKAAMMGAGAIIRPEFQAINALAERLGNRLPGTTSELTDMMTMLMRQGMSAKAVLGGVGEATAYLAAQLKMPYQDAAEFSAKLQDATRTTEKDMMGLMDTIQRTFYLGVDSNNMLEGFTKLSPALQIIRKDGLAAARELAPLLVMLDQAGMKGEPAGNALRKVFQLGMMKGGKAGLNFTNGKGEFGGLDKLFSQLAKLRKFNTQERLDKIKDVFGDDAETLQTVALLIDKGKVGYEEIQAKMAAQASLQERVNLQLGTLKNLWEAATGTFTNALVAVGESVAPEVRAITIWLGETTAKAQAWAKANPALAAGLMKVGAALAMILVALGGLALVAATLIGPFAILRYSIALIGPVVGGVATAVSGALSGILAFGRAALALLPSLPAIRIGLMMAAQSLLAFGRAAMMAHPVTAIIAILGTLAYTIWANWDWLKAKFTALWASIPEGARRIIPGLLGVFLGVPGQMIGIGIQIVNGLGQGIMSRIGALKATISNAASAVAEAARGALGIKSPSRVFAAIGGNIVAGLNHGLASNQDSAVERVTHLSRKLSAAGSIAIDRRPPMRSAMLASGGGGNTYITMHVHAAPGMDEAALAQMVEQRIAQAGRSAQARARSRLSDAD